MAASSGRRGAVSRGGCFRVFSSPLGFLSEKQLRAKPLCTRVLAELEQPLTMATTTPAGATSLGP